MPCEFEAQRPSRYRFHDSIGCQFDCSDQELIIYDGKSWCPAHVSIDFEPEDAETSYLFERKRNEFIRSSIDKQFEKTTSNDAFDYIDLSGVVFPDSYILQFHETLPNIIFNRCEFHNRPSFTDCTFSGDTWFEGSSFFKGGGSFLRSKFKTGVRFDEVSFCSGTTFTGAQFSDFVDFSEASFESVTFSEAIFRSEASFSNAEFTEFISFNQAKFLGKAIFFGAHFSQGLRLDVKGPVLANFREAELNGPIFFSDIEFKALILADAKFGNGKAHNSSPRLVTQSSGYPAPDSSAYLREDLASLIKFDGMVCEGIFDFSASYYSKGDDGYILPKTSFVQSRFHGEATFENRIFGASTNFTKARFKRAPKFHGCVLHQDTSFYNTKFLDYKYLRKLRGDERSTEVEKAARAFRTLKLASENTRGVQEQASFFALEEQRNRLDPNTKFSVKIVSLVYDGVSNYGRNYFRPLRLLTIFSLLFCSIYAFILTLAGIRDELMSNSVTFTMKQIVRPFWIWSETIEFSGMNGYFWVYIIKTIATMQSLLSLLFIALFFLALRRRFKMS